MRTQDLSYIPGSEPALPKSESCPTSAWYMCRTESICSRHIKLQFCKFPVIKYSTVGLLLGNVHSILNKRFYIVSGSDITLCKESRRNPAPLSAATNTSEKNFSNIKASGEIPKRQLSPVKAISDDHFR